MKYGWLVALIFYCNVSNAQASPGDDFKTSYTKEVKTFEAALKAGKSMEAEHSLQALLQMQQRYKKQLETKLKTMKDSDDNAEMIQRVEDEETIIARLKELSVDIDANKQEILEEMKSFLDE
jgi:hypothetical protein